jgi:hypothetical protein
MNKIRFNIQLSEKQLIKKKLSLKDTLSTKKIKKKSWVFNPTKKLAAS